MKVSDDIFTAHGREFFDLSPSLFSIVGTDGCFKALSAGWQRALGWKTAKLLDRPFMDFVHPDDATNTRIVFEKMLADMPVSEHRNRYRCANGTYRWLHWTWTLHLEAELIYTVATDITDAKAAEEGAQEAREARRAAQRRCDEAAAEARRALDEVRALRERLALHRSGAPECPSCGQALAGEAARRVARRDEAALSEAARRAGEAVAQEKEAAAREGAAGERERLAEERARDAARRALEAAARRAALEAARAALDEASRELAGAKEELEAAVKEADEAAAVDEAETRREAETLDEARRTADALGQRRTDAKRARERAEAAGAEHARLVGLAATLARRLEEAVDARRALGEAERRRDAAERRGRLFATLAEAFGHNGIPSLVYEGVVAELEADATSVLSTLSGGRLSLRLATARETKRGTSVDTLDFVVCDGEEERSYEALSGGERMRVDVALRVGLARLLARRSGAPISMLVVDESFSSLDPEGIAATVECLGALAEEIPLVLAVTHTPAIAEAFPVRIRVSADSDPAISVEEAA